MEAPKDDLVDEAKRIVGRAKEADVTLRLVGGIAVRLTSPSAWRPPLQRTYKDIDLIGRASETKGLKMVFGDLGYVPRETFNAMQGGRRMIFNDMANMRRVDIFLDYFEMCHKFDLRKRLGLREDTLALADLLATKLQIVQANDKDYKDMIAILSDHPLRKEEGKDLVDVSRIVDLCSDDWGVWKTFTMSLERLVVALNDYPLDEAVRKDVEGKTKSLLESIQASPKSIRWRVRSRVGEKVAWHENPEADVSVLDSRF